MATKSKTSSRGIQIGFTHLLIVGVLLLIGIASRFLLIDYPNFKPIAAIAIFCGFYFSRMWIGLAAAAGIMLISDLAIGFYDWPVMISVYGSILVACVFGRQLIGWMEEKRLFGKLMGLSVAALLASAVFFLLTNSAVVIAGWYPISVDGFVSSFAAGLPFFKYTLLGNLLFTVGIFAMYEVLSAVLRSTFQISNFESEITTTS